MGVKSYLERTPVFTIKDFREKFPSITGYNLLRRAVASNKVFHIVRGLYASNTGRYTDINHDRFEIAARLAPDAVIAYHSALELYGVAHSLTNRVQYYSLEKKKVVTFQSNTYKRYPPPNGHDLLTQTVNVSDYIAVHITTKEQTLLDCIARLGRGGGAEEVLRSVTGFPYIDVESVKAIAAVMPSSVIARIGWLLEQKKGAWDVSEEDLNFLENLLTGTAYRFVSRANKDNGWSKRWKLLLPAPETEMRDWIQ